MNLQDVVAAVLRLDPSAHAISFDDHWYTWGDVAAIGDRTFEVMEAGVVPNDVSIGVVMRNDPRIASFGLGALARSRSILAFSPLFPDEALAADIVDTRPAVLVVTPEDAARPALRAAAATAGALVVIVDDSGATASEDSGFDPATDHHRADKATAASMLTSGTTGPPKRFPIRFDTLDSAIVAATAHHEGGDAELVIPTLKDATSIIDLPLFNITSYLDLASIVVAGRRMCLMRRFDPRAWAAAVRDHRVVVALLVPTAMRMVYDADVPKDWLRSLRVVRSGSAPLDPALAAAFEDKYDIPVIVAYGATEFSGALSSLTMKHRREFGTAKCGSVGRAHPGVELKIVDRDTGAEMPSNEIGLLVARAPQVTGGDADGWVRTTDLARIDEDGFVYIAGRADDVIIRGGFKVDPTEVARTLELHPAVKEAAVVGLADERLGHVPVAAVVLDPDVVEVPGEEQLRAWVREKLPPYAVPVRIRLLEALPRTPSLKIAKAVLAELLSSE